MGSEPGRQFADGTHVSCATRRECRAECPLNGHPGAFGALVNPRVKKAPRPTGYALSPTTLFRAHGHASAVLASAIRAPSRFSTMASWYPSREPQPAAPE